MLRALVSRDWMWALSALLLAGGMLACRAAAPRPIALLEESCGYCRMTITDARFGGELVAPSGKVLTFDSIECLAAYVGENEHGADSSSVPWVADYARPDTWLPARRAVYLHAKDGRSPMGRGLRAFATGGDARALATANGDEILQWDDVVALAHRSLADSARQEVGGAR